MRDWNRVAVLLVGAICLPSPVVAQDVSADVTSLAADSAATAAVNSGIRTSESGGFTLLEHGLWTGATVVTGAAVTDRPGVASSGLRLRTISPPRSTSSFRRSTWLPWVYAAENRHGLPYGLLDALIWTESRYNPMALSHAGAAGLAQLMPGTAQEVGVSNRYDPAASIEGGAKYLRRMLDRFGSVHLALAAYNAGPGAVAKAGGIPLNSETPTYVRNVLTGWGLR